MIGWTFHAIFNFLFGWASIDMLVGFAAVAVAVLEPAIISALIPDLRKWAIATAVVAFTCMGILAHGYSSGLAEKQGEWNAALAKEVSSGAKILSDAERDARSDTPDSLRNDKWNRGSRKLSGVH